MKSKKTKAVGRAVLLKPGMVPAVPMEQIERQERARRTALAKLKKRGGGAMTNRRVGLSFSDWQLAILAELGEPDGLKIATMLKRDIMRLYPTLRRKPAAESVQVDLLQGSTKTKTVAAPRAAVKAGGKSGG